MKNIYRVLIIFMAIFASVPVLFLARVFTGKISFEAKVESEIVNGLITVSGLIFAFQPTFFRHPKEGILRLVYLAIFLVEGLLLGLTGYNYVVSTLDLGYLTTSTLLFASGSLFLNISMTAFFVLADLMIQSYRTNPKL